MVRTALIDTVARIVDEKPIRFAFVLAMIPVVMFTIVDIGRTKTPAPIVPAKAPPADVGPRVVRTESISTLDGRWSAFASPPPAIEKQEVRPVTRERDVAGAVSGATSLAPQPASSSRHRLRTKRARLIDVCSRHGMKRVEIRRGKYWRGWRCRR
jgi:hypothetical protein